MKCPYCNHENIEGMDTCEACSAGLLDVPPSALDIEASVAESLRSEPLSALEPQPVVGLSPNATVAEAVKVLAQRNIGCVLVVWANALVGIFSERDVLLKIGSDYARLAEKPIRHYMTPAPVTLTPDDSIAFALNRMDVNDFRHIPLEENEQVAGIISVRDVLGHITRQFPELSSPPSN